MNSRGRNLVKIIQNWAPVLLQPKIEWAETRALLAALAEVESNFGENAVPKYEKAFDWNGPWARPDILKRWGAWGACSYSSFQIMYQVAVELGFDSERSPAELHEDEVAFIYVAAYIDRRILRCGAKSVRDFADGYNSGSHRDDIIPIQYIERFETAYDEALPVVASWV